MLSGDKPSDEGVCKKDCLKDALKRSFFDNLDGYSNFEIPEELLNVNSVRTEQLIINTQRIQEITEKLEEHHRLTMQSAIDYIDESMVNLANDQEKLKAKLKPYLDVEESIMKLKYR